MTKIRGRVEEIEPDVFVIAGDISGRRGIFSDSLAQLYVENTVNLYVASRV